MDIPFIEDDNIEALQEIDRWQAKRFKTGKISGIMDAIFYPVDRLVDFIVPDSVVEKAVKPIIGTLRLLQNSSRKFVDVGEIIRRSSHAGVEVNSIRDFKDVPISYLDVLAQSLFERNASLAALHGAGLGMGSYALAFVDLPMLFTVNLKMILQIGACYGYDPGSLEEEEFALRIFCIVSADGKERESEIAKMDELIVRFVKGTFSYEMGIMATEETIQGFVNKVVRRHVRKAATRKLPLLGIALGSGFNYLFTKEIATYAYMFHRKRYLKEMLSGGEDNIT